MKKKEEGVVALLSIEVSYHTVRHIHAARVRKLGLTAYGDTEKEACDKIDGMFSAFVEMHRKRGTLEKALNESGFAWCLASEYKSGLSTSKAKDNEKQKLLSCAKTNERPWRTTGELVFT